MRWQFTHCNQFGWKSSRNVVGRNALKKFILLFREFIDINYKYFKKNFQYANMYVQVGHCVTLFNFCLRTYLEVPGSCERVENEKWLKVRGWNARVCRSEGKTTHRIHRISAPPGQSKARYFYKRNRESSLRKFYYIKTVGVFHTANTYWDITF